MLMLIFKCIVGLIIFGILCAAFRPLADILAPRCAPPVEGSWDAICQIGIALMPICDAIVDAGLYIINGITELGGARYYIVPYDGPLPHII